MTYLTGEEKPSLEELAHHGTKGMKWGVRRTDGGSMGSQAQKVLGKSETKFQQKRSDANARVRQDQASGVLNPKNKSRAAKLNAQHQMNQKYLKAQGLETFKVASARGKTHTEKTLKKNGPMKIVKRGAIGVTVATGAAAATALGIVYHQV